MTGLLVSVRCAEEAVEAVAGGVDLLDVKEPSRGPLGAAEHPTALAVGEIAAAAGLPLSLALGELRDYAPPPGWPPELAFAKIGLAGLDGGNWSAEWLSWSRTLPAGALPVLVAYADSVNARSPAPEEVLERAGELGGAVLLLDTFEKRRGNLLSVLGPRRLARLRGGIRRAGLQAALAGSLQLPHVAEMLRYQPEWLGFRGAACEGGRSGCIGREQVARLRLAIRPPASLPAG